MLTFDSLDAAVAGMEAAERDFRAGRDRRSIFLSAYVVITREMRDAVRAGGFLDNAWVERYAVAFANLYQRALAAYAAGDRENVPKSWRLAFDAARGGATLVTQDLLLGVNAHINHDLALALDEVSIGPDRDRRRRDHAAVNAILRAATDRLQDRISAMYAPGLSALDAAAGRFDEAASGFSVEVARDAAWEGAVSLANARSGLERSLIRTRLNVQAAAIARLILSPSLNPALIARLRAIEESARWWECVAASH